MMIVGSRSHDASVGSSRGGAEPMCKHRGDVRLCAMWRIVARTHREAEPSRTWLGIHLCRDGPTACPTRQRDVQPCPSGILRRSSTLVWDVEAPSTLAQYVCSDELVRRVGNRSLAPTGSQCRLTDGCNVNRTVSIGKFGSFPSNALLGRPYNLTFEVVDSSETKGHTSLRVVPASELHSELLNGGQSIPARECKDRPASGDEATDYDSNGETGVMRTNQEIVDDPNRQRLTAEEIETLKTEGGGAGRDLIAQLMRSHTAIDQKTEFSLAKYALRKARKYMRRFTVLPLDVPTLTRYLMTERDPTRIMELREEIVSLMASWANVHWNEGSEWYGTEGEQVQRGNGRWLVVDETGGFVVAAMAERMGILHAPEVVDGVGSAPSSSSADKEIAIEFGRTGVDDADEVDDHTDRRHHRRRKPAMSAISNTITVIHANAQPNLSILKYFLFDPSNPSSDHPLYTHLKSISWLQLLSPDEDTGYVEPERVAEDVLRTWKSGKRTAYFRKRRRWERVKGVVEETGAGGFDGLVVASMMDPTDILNSTVPLLRGGAPVVVYSPNIEPLVDLADLYCTPRRAAFLSDPPDPQNMPNEDFPVNPTLLLAPTVQTARLQGWQCLPGRTHPLMMGRGGAEGYLFTAIRVLPAEGKIEARGKAKRRKLTIKREDASGQVERSSTSTPPSIGDRSDLLTTS